VQSGVAAKAPAAKLPGQMDVHPELRAYLQRTTPNASYGHPGY
jgi:hypothetical protein